MFSLYLLYVENAFPIYLEEMIYFLRFHTRDPGFGDLIDRLVDRLMSYEDACVAEDQCGEDYPPELYILCGYLAGKLNMSSMIK